jgi:phosphoserine aminotransferase
MDPDRIVVPPELRPADGRFGSGPSKVRLEAVAALARAAPTLLGRSHRRDPVRALVGRLREGLRALFALPADYEVVLGNGGAALLWDAMTIGFIERRSQHLVFGEFSSKFAEAVALAPHLRPPEVIESEPGTHPLPEPSDDVDVYALTHNETSTGVAMPVARVADAGLVAVDATSAAGALEVDPAEFDVYYFSPQKVLASDGGLWIALCSPAALERIARLGDSDRHIPAVLDLLIAVENSRSNQTYNTPSIATLFLAAEQVDWILDAGGLAWSVARCARSADILYGWAETHARVTPFVKNPDQRSRVVATIDLDPRVDAGAVTRALAANGIFDTEPYRKLQRNQLRVALYPAIEPDDVERLTRSIDHVIDALERA